MATEIEQKPPTGDKSINDANKTGDALLQDLDESDYKDFTESQNKSENNSPENGRPTITDGQMTIPPLFGRDNKPGDTDKATKDDDEKSEEKEEKEKSEKADKRVEDSKEIALDPETQEAKDNFVKILADRDPNLLKALGARLDQMDQRILHERVQKDDGSYINQQEQLTEVYKNLALIGTDAEKLTYKGKDGNTHQVYSQPWMVNNILASAVIRGADPEHFYNQGSDNTCAAESINRQGAALLAGVESKTIADMCTKGKFEAKDNQGNTFTCRVNRESLILDREAREIYWQPTNARDAYGQLGDLRTAQANLDIMNREANSRRGLEGGEGRYVYKQVAPINRRDTGERVIDTTNGKVVAHSPCLDGKAISDVKQSLFGHYISPNFGKDTTLVADSAFNISNVTGIKNGQHLTSHLKALEDRGLKFATIGTHVGRYKEGTAGLGGGEGWHATSVQLNDKGGIDFVNNWGGAHDYKNLNANKLFSWMHAPDGSSIADRRRGDHVFDPSGLDPDGRNPVRDEIAKEDKEKLGLDQNKTKKDKDEELLAQIKKARQREQEEHLRQAQQAQAQLHEIQAKLAGLSDNDPERAKLLDQQEFYENNSQLS